MQVVTLGQAIGPGEQTHSRNTAFEFRPVEKQLWGLSRVRFIQRLSVDDSPAACHIHVPFNFYSESTQYSRGHESVRAKASV